MNQAVLRAAETGKKTISASMMMSVLRPHSDKMLFTAVVPPICLIRHAQDEGVLNATEKDAEMKAGEKKENVKTKKMRGLREGRAGAPHRAQGQEGRRVGSACQTVPPGGEARDSESVGAGHGGW
eukprot:6981820-Prymnesium_polylepis.1